MKVVGLTHRGRERARNEDCFLVRSAHPCYLLAVADGMGGHAAGDRASSLAIASLERLWAESVPQANGESRILLLRQMFNEANILLLQEAAADQDKQGMGTTLTAGLLYETHIVIGHVGDSRAYLVEEGFISLLTEDHSLVRQMVNAGTLSLEEAREHPQRHVLTRALGTAPDLEVDILEYDLAEGSTLLFCTDGLTSLVEDDEIAACIKMYSDTRQAAAELINLANARGGYDNITVVLATGIGRQTD